MKNLVDILILVTSVFLSGLRIFGEKGEVFQAAAHLFVGGLIGAWLVARRPLHGWLVVVLSVIEIACFLLLKSE